MIFKFYEITFIFGFAVGFLLNVQNNPVKNELAESSRNSSSLTGKNIQTAFTDTRKNSHKALTSLNNHLQ